MNVEWQDKKIFQLGQQCSLILSLDLEAPILGLNVKNIIANSLSQYDGEMHSKV